MDIVFVGDAIYQVGTGSFYRSVFFNSTIQLIERPPQWEIVSLVSYLLFASVFALVVYILLSVFSTSTTKAVKSVIRRTSNASAPAEVDLDDFLPDHLKGTMSTKKTKPKKQ